MRVLIVSHTALSETTNMGKTLLAQFEGWPASDLAQFYIHSGMPGSAACGRYYSFSDVDALKSVFVRWHHGRVYKAADVQTDQKRPGSPTLDKVYVNARRRKLHTYLIRDAIWFLSNRYSRHFRTWLKEFDPEVVYLVPGDYRFTYEIGRWICKKMRIPMVVSCMDDYFMYNPFGSTLPARLWRGLFMRSVHKTMASAAAIQTICSGMAKQYGSLFKRPCFTLYSSAQKKSLSVETDKATQISYVGNIGLGRAEQLADIGKAMQSINIPGLPNHIDVYSGEQRPELLALMVPENGIHFHGSIPPDQVAQVYACSIAAIHVETCDPVAVDRVRYSVSTKIAELMSYGPCVLAYGPADVASVAYLTEEESAFIATDKEMLPQVLRDLLTDEKKRAEVLTNARNAAQKNHDSTKNMEQLRNWLQRTITDTGV